MKYIILQTADGQRFPIAFPEAFTHCFVAGAMQLVLDTLDPKKDLRPKQLDTMLASGSGKVVAAGFCNTGRDFACFGESESLGAVSRPALDEAIFAIGQQAGFLGDDMLPILWAQTKKHKKD